MTAPTLDALVASPPLSRLPEFAMKHWLWHFADAHGPWFGVVVADSQQAAERLVRLRLASECDDIPAVIHLQQCREDFTMAKGYL